MTLAVLGLVKEWAPLHFDTARDLLLARECVEGAHCAQAGPPTSFGGLVQGALWSHVLEFCLRAGLSLRALGRCTDVMIALSALCVPLIARNPLRLTASWLTWALWLPLTLASCEYPVLWNPTFTPLALAVFSYVLLRAAAGGSPLWFVLAALALGVAIDLHVAHGLLVPFLVCGVFALGRRPFLVGPLVVALPLAFHAWDSPGAFAMNRLVLEPHVELLLLGLVVAALSGFLLRARAEVLEPAQRARLVGVLLCAYLVGSLLLLRVVTGHEVALRYLAPTVTPGVILASDRLSAALVWLSRRVPRLTPSRVGLALGSLVALERIASSVSSRADVSPFKLHELEPLAASLYGGGRSFEELRRHVRGVDAYELVGMLAALEPPAFHPAAEARPEDVLVVRARRPALPASLPGERVDLGGGNVALVWSYLPFVRTDTAEVCRTNLWPPSEPECHQLRLDDGRFDAVPNLGLGERAYPLFPAIFEAFQRREFGGQRISYRFVLQVPAGAPARRLRTISRRGTLAWQIARVDGVAVTGSLPANQIVIGPGAAIGSIEITAEIAESSAHAYNAWLPAFVELPVDAAALDPLLPP